jgi:hypothetical protein
MFAKLTREITDFIQNKDLYSREEQEAIRRELKKEADLLEEKYLAGQEVKY